MEKRKSPVVTILTAAILVALIAVIVMLAPATLRDYKALEIERNATPTPTMDNSSVLFVTNDPQNTPTPTVLLLRVGSAGDEVTRLQTRLKELGYYSGEVDGQYGQGTADAVKLFQGQHNLIADGIAGTDTRFILYGANAEPCVPTATPSPMPTLLKKGDNGDAVRDFQTRLKELGYYAGSVDGDFGGGTQEAVRLFQSQNGLDVDGVAAAQTLSLLYSDAAKQVTATPTPDPGSMPILVNRTHTMDESYKPADLVVLRNVLKSSVVYVKGSEIEGDRTAAAALETMFEAAQADGVSGWQISAGYRSVSYQQKLFDDKVAEFKKQGMSTASATSATRQTVADAGASEHHTGLAFDITVADTIFLGTPQQKWLAKHCWDYGFIIRYQKEKEDITGFLAECWHIRYVGVTHSVAMRDKNLCLEEYLGETT